MEKTLEELELKELEEKMYRMITAPPGTCCECGVDFITISPRTTCTKCLGMGVEPFSPMGIVISIVICAALILPLMWALH